MMELNDLSTNWKNLQASWNHNIRKPSKSLKRNASRETYKSHSKSVKRREDHLCPNNSSEPKANTEIQAHGLGVGSSTHKSTALPVSLAHWAADHDLSVQDLTSAYGAASEEPTTLGKLMKDEKINGGLSSDVEAGKYVAIDCEMVGVGPSPDQDSALARISLVDYHGRQLYDSFVLPKEAVTDYRTFVSGITPQLLRSARTLEAVQVDVAKLLEGRILVGHAIRHDLEALLLGHPKRDIRDTSKYPRYRQLAGGRTPSLKRLAREILGIDIQTGEHSSVEDARVAMLLFRREKEGFEREHVKIWGTRHKSSSGTMAEVATNPDNKRKKKKKRKNKRR